MAERDTDRHRPDPAFIERLEDELRGAIRRHDRFAGVAPRPKRLGRRLVVLATIAFASMALGATGTLMMTSEARGHQEMARLRAETALTLATAARSESERFGEQSRESLGVEGIVSRLATINGTEAVLLRESERDEVRYRRSAPLDSITADVLGRDFVRERLVIRQEAAHDRERELSANEADPLAETRLVEELIKVRDGFLAGRISAERAELEAHRLQLAAECEEWRLRSTLSAATSGSSRDAERLRATSLTIASRLAYAEMELEAVEAALRALESKNEGGGRHE